MWKFQFQMEISLRSTDIEYIEFSQALYKIIHIINLLK